MEGIKKNESQKVSLPISLAKRTGLEIKKLTRTLRVVNKVNKQYVNKQLTKLKHRTVFVKRDNNKCTNNVSKIQAQKSTIQYKIKPINDENENPPF